jgi:hypothetical protein
VAVAALLGEPPALSLDQEQSHLGIALLAVGELAGSEAMSITPLRG